jgi:DNA polymerase I-like protein with 3'-5' exonuclease and polymerase domains
VALDAPHAITAYHTPMTVRQPLSGRVALVAGATRGAGRAFAIELATAGAIVYATGRSSQNHRSEIDRPESIEGTAARAAEAGGEAVPVVCDHLEPSQVRELVSRIDSERGRLDILVNNIWGGDHLTAWDAKLWEHDLDAGLPEVREHEQELSQWVVNPRSPQQVMAALNGLGMRPPDTTADTLKMLHDKEFTKSPTSEKTKFLDAMLRYRKEQKVMSTYIKGPRKRLLDGRVYPTYMLHGSVSGRTASRNPNMQNIVRSPEIRRLYVPDEGNLFVQADYAQIELRVAAAYARDKRMQEVFRDPSRDIHGEIADVLYGEGNWTKEQRVRAKATVFGSLYGREAASIAQEFGIPHSEAYAIQKAFFAMMPELAEWRDKVQHKVFKGGQALQTHFGRKRRFWLITKQNKMDVSKEALSFLPQSTANDITLAALVQLRRDFHNTDVKPRIPVHDSIMFECPAQEAKDVGHHMAETMERVAAEEFSDFVPFTADAEIGRSWGELVEQ